MSSQRTGFFKITSPGTSLTLNPTMIVTIPGTYRVDDCAAKEEFFNTQST